MIWFNKWQYFLRFLAELALKLDKSLELVIAYYCLAGEQRAS